MQEEPQGPPWYRRALIPFAALISSLNPGCAANVQRPPPAVVSAAARPLAATGSAPSGPFQRPRRRRTEAVVREPPAPAKSPPANRGADGTGTPETHRVTIRGEPGRSIVLVDGLPIFPPEGFATVVSQPQWSPSGRNVAFLSRQDSGPGLMLVVLARARKSFEIITWPLPTLRGHELNVFWTGDNRLLVGRSVLDPKFSAEFGCSGACLVSAGPLRDRPASSARSSLLQASPSRALLAGRFPPNMAAASSPSARNIRRRRS